MFTLSSKKYRCANWQTSAFILFFIMIAAPLSNAQGIASQKSTIVPGLPIYYDPIITLAEGTDTDIGGTISVSPHFACELSVVPPFPNTCITNQTATSFADNALSIGLNEATQVLIKLGGPPAITPFDLVPLVGEFGIIHSKFVELAPSPYQYYEGISTHKVTFDAATADAAPVITLLGTSPTDHPQGTTYTDAGATATDDIDGDVTANIVVGGDVIDATTPLGTFTITYDVSDAAGNAAVQITRTVNVITADTTPVITLLGITPVDHTQGSVYTDAGATASDDVDGDITANIVVGGDTIDATTPVGTYTITYDVSDAAGNAAVQITRTVNVIATDITPPVITLLGNLPTDHAEGTAYTDPGATAIDNVDGDITVGIIVAGDIIDATTPLGTYTVTYDITDTAGNAALQVTRTVNVVPDVVLLTTITGTVTGGEETRLNVTHDIGDGFNPASQSVDTAVTTLIEPLTASDTLTLIDNSVTALQPVFAISDPEFPNSVGASTPGTARLGRVNYDGDFNDRRMGELTLVKLPTAYSALELDNRVYNIRGHMNIVRPDRRLSRCLAEGLIAFDTNNSNGGSVATLVLSCVSVNLTEVVQGGSPILSPSLTLGLEQVASVSTNVGSDGSIRFTFNDILTIPIDDGGDLSIGLGNNFVMEGFVQEGSNLIVLKATADNGGNPGVASAIGLVYATGANF